MKPAAWLSVLIVLFAPVLVGQNAPPAGEHVLMKVLSEELAYSIENLKMPDGTQPYFLAYTVTDHESASVRAELGAIYNDSDSHRRILDVDVRVGDYQLDNTHKIRGGFDFDFGSYLGGGAASLSLEDDPIALKQAIWLATDQSFKSAVKKYQRVRTNLKTKVEEEDKSADFSKEDPVKYSGPKVSLHLDRKQWAERLRNISALVRKYPLIYNSSVSLSATAANRYLVNSEGAQIQDGQKLLRLFVTASTRAEDGMDLYQSYGFNASSEDKLPTDAEILKKFSEVIQQVLALRKAPLVEPYTGPAILVNRSAGVFFHEIFGHRIEGHRQKDVEEGQTFTKKVGKSILPEFLTIRDDPTRARFGNIDLRGFYRYDDEGVPAQDVLLVDKGVLKTFLMSRSPIKGFPRSNGHGRRNPGAKVVSRMGNTIIQSEKTVPFPKLREMLIEECKKQEKPFGLLFQDISGGFTGTRRAGAQVFKVLPLVVYRVYADGRPDELVRGVDIVGTPLTCFSKVTCTGDDPAVFNGTCGAESGSVPVSAISPSLLVSEVEVEKRSREQERPPILKPPVAERGEGQ